MNTEAYGLFERCRDSGFNIIQPKGYKIIWENVLVNQDGKPCILTTGKYIGFFASKTALKNDLKKSERGECDCNDQVDPLIVPTLVLAGRHPQYGASPVTIFGAHVGDLLVAYNPNNKKIVYAIAGDMGPENNLGEGSVIMNMKLKGITNYPKNIGEPYGLGTKNNVTICIIPASKTYQAERPYTQENIQRSIGRWFVGLSKMECLMKPLLHLF